jgi:transcription elongation factor Elf1
MNDEREKEGKGPTTTRLESYETEWTCLACGERRFNTEADSVTETTA